MNFSTAARLAISAVMLVASCNRESDEGARSAERAETRAIAPDQLRSVLPPRLQGPDGPYSKAAAAAAPVSNQ